MRRWSDQKLHEEEEEEKIRRRVIAAIIIILLFRVTKKTFVRRGISESAYICIFKKEEYIFIICKFCLTK